MSSKGNYEELGLMVGIEIHQQLNSKTKLFCNCPTELQGTRDADYFLYRKHRPVLGETGEFDQAMLVEFLKRGNVIYEAYQNCTCSYDVDEKPPFIIDEEATSIALEIALMLHMNIIDELHVMRKNYVDGSVPAGFQRTSVLGLDGDLILKTGKKIGIESIFIEEDAARKSKKEGKTTYFKLDRLGIPLVEITTAPDIRTPQEARDAAYRIGLLLKSTNKVKTVLGSIRQDLNISIREGKRIEIKGVQKLDWIPILIDNEIKRQLALVEIKKTLQERNVTVDDKSLDTKNVIDLSKDLKDNGCAFVKEGIKKGLKLKGIKLSGFKGLFGLETLPGERFGTEVAGKVKTLTTLKGLIHSDEKLKDSYKFTDKDIEIVKKKLNVDEEKSHDLFILLLGPQAELDKAFDIIVTRVKMAFDGVTPETRKANDDGTTVFLRELSGGRRLYPDTDSLPFTMTEDLISQVQENLGKYPWEIIKEFAKKYSVKEDAIENLIVKGKLGLFNELVKISPYRVTLIITTITEELKALKREGVSVKNLKDSHFIQLFKALEDGKIAKEAVIAILEVLSSNPNMKLEEAKKKAGISDVSEGKVEEIIDAIIAKNSALIKEKKMGAMGPLMGDAMKELRGAADGKVINSLLKKKIMEEMKK